jgi:hypothetical protein
MLVSTSLKAAESNGESASSSTPGKNIALSGLIEVEGALTDPSDGKTSSDLVLATFELGLEAKLNEQYSAHATLLYEEDGDDELLVDEAYIRMAPSKFPFIIEAGRMTQAFGDFATGMIADPLTLELAETKHHATLKLGYEEGVFAASLSAFKSDVQKDEDDRINTIVAAVSVADEESEKLRYRAGASWMNNIAATDGLSGDFYDDTVEDYAGTTGMVGGVGLYGMIGFGPVDLRAEYITALDEFEDGARAGKQPLAWNLEAEYAISGQLALTLRYSGATDFDVRHQYGAALGYEIMENTAAAFEYLHEKGRVEDGVAGDRDLFTLQLAMEF